MPTPREELEGQLTKLKRAIRSGALTVEHGDKRVTYRNMRELREALQGIEDELDEVDGKRRPRRMFYLGTDRGF